MLGSFALGNEDRTLFEMILPILVFLGFGVPFSVIIAFFVWATFFYREFDPRSLTKWFKNGSVDVDVTNYPQYGPAVDDWD